jgi:hypothetical protein
MNSGKSERINFRTDDEVFSILKEVENDSRFDKSRFIREAIVFYWKNEKEPSINLVANSSSKVEEEEINNITLSEVEPDDKDVVPNEIHNGTWVPSWKSS